MKKLLTTLCATIISLGAMANSFEEFQTSAKEAFTEAKEDKKIVFALFSGTDWCPPCMRLEKNVISKSEFTKALNDKYVFLLLDFPRYRRLKEATARQNNLLLDKYKVESFPTIVLIAPDGTELKKMSYIPNSSVKNFLIWFNNETRNIEESTKVVETEVKK